VAAKKTGAIIETLYAHNVEQLRGTLQGFVKEALVFATEVRVCGIDDHPLSPFA
jgi:hypothetical protein